MVPDRRVRGFTLVELMMVVTIIGLLASLAIPAFKGFIVHTKQVERKTVQEEVYHSLERMYSDKNAYGYNFGSFSYMWGNYNPPLPLRGGKKPWDNTMPGWKDIDFQPTGDLYHQYYVFAYSYTGFRLIFLMSVADLDGDGIFHYHYYEKYGWNGDLDQTWEWDWPDNSD